MTKYGLHSSFDVNMLAVDSFVIILKINGFTVFSL